MTPKADPALHSVWLCPEAEVYAGISAEIASLTELSQAPAFEPHVTLLGDISGDPQHTAAQCQRAFDGVGQIIATVTGVAQAEAFYMSLFLDLNVPDVLFVARKNLAVALGCGAASNYCPHISLAYGLAPEALPTTTLSDLEKRFVGREMVLSELVLVASAKDIPIEKWRRISTFSM